MSLPMFFRYKRSFKTGYFTLGYNNSFSCIIKRNFAFRKMTYKNRQFQQVRTTLWNLIIEDQWRSIEDYLIINLQFKEIING